MMVDIAHFTMLKIFATAGVTAAVGGGGWLAANFIEDVQEVSKTFASREELNKNHAQLLSKIDELQKGSKTDVIYIIEQLDKRERMTVQKIEDLMHSHIDIHHRD